MRKQMPVTAEIVDWLRGFLGPVAADQVIRKGMAGQGGFWVEERCPDGVVRTFGSKAP